MYMKVIRILGQASCKYRFFLIIFTLVFLQKWIINYIKSFYFPWHSYNN